MIHVLARIYRYTGIHGAPPGTLLNRINSLVQFVVRRSRYDYSNTYAAYRAQFGGIPYYDIKRLRKTRKVDGLALIFFMGVGDYLMATPLIRALHLAHPDLPIYAYGSTHADSVNSPLVIDLLKLNPLINRVFTYRGRPREIWTDYDFQDVLKDIPTGFAILPVVYDVDPVVFHRATSLLETFGLPVDLPLPAPIAYPGPLSPVAAELLNKIQARIGQASPRAVVCTHFGTRSSGYEYPHATQLVSRLARRECFVVSFSPTGLNEDNVIDIDVSTVTPGDTIELLRALKQGTEPLFVLSVNSLMWPVSAALDIPNLGLHVFRDRSMHQYLYPNIFVVTSHYFSTLPAFRLFLAPPRCFQKRQSTDGATTFIDYKPEYVLDSFETVCPLIAT